MTSSLLSDITARLVSTSDTPSLDASVLLAHVTGKSRIWVLAHPELIATSDQQRTLESLMARIEDGEPFPYVLGHWEFFGLDLEVTPDVLIPRPETELMVEKAITWLRESPLRRTVADVGTGSGAIAVAIAANVPDAKILATDISAEALQVAERNAKKLHVDSQVEFVECDLLPAKPDLFTTEQHLDLLCANLPYIPRETLYTLPVYGREPTTALDGGEDGLTLIRKLLNIAPGWLAPNSMILLEIEATTGIRALSLAYDLFSEAEIHLHQDLSGHDRLLEIML